MMEVLLDLMEHLGPVIILASCVDRPIPSWCMFRFVFVQQW